MRNPRRARWSGVSQLASSVSLPPSASVSAAVALRQQVWQGYECSFHRVKASGPLSRSEGHGRNTDSTRIVFGGLPPIYSAQRAKYPRLVLLLTATAAGLFPAA